MSGGIGTGMGGIPWGGAFISGGGIPCPADFDVYCFCDNAVVGGIPILTALGDIFSDPDVHPSSGGSAVVNPVINTLTLLSNGSGPEPYGFYLTIDKVVPRTWTAQFVVTLDSIPANFATLVSSHVYLGTVDQTGLSAGLFISSIGIAYSGAVDFGPTGDLILEGPFQVIPGTADLITTGVKYEIRIAADAVTSTTYIFVTKYSDKIIHGDNLVAVLPGIPSLGAIEDGTTISVRGTAGMPSQLTFDAICLASRLLMADVPPISNAGKDQALRKCAVGTLDGSASYDPDGGALVYNWRLIDAPVSSSFAYEGADGATVPDIVPSGFTSKFYSSELGLLSFTDPIVPGDVLVVDGEPYSILELNVDGGGYFAKITDELLLDSLVNTHFKVLRQRFLTNADTVEPSFFADVPGIYKFDLRVFDGQYYSLPSSVIVNVLESQVPKGCIPDLGFVWQYLSDFWKLVEDRERIQVLWESMAQVVAAELLTLWQTDYSKSLRDIQRTFQRRWLHYDLKLPEPAPDLTSVRRMYGGVTTNTTLAPSLGGVNGTVLVVESPAHATLTIHFVLSNPYTPYMLQTNLQSKLKGADPRYSVVLVDGYVRIVAPFTFYVGSGTTVPVFDIGSTNVHARGTLGARIGPRSYKVEMSLTGLDIQLNDLLVVDGVGYRITRTADDSSDLLRFQRIIVEQDLPVSIGHAWSIPSCVNSRFLNFYEGMLSTGDTAVLEVFNSTGVLELLGAVVVGACAAESTKLGIDIAAIDQYLSRPSFTAYLAYCIRKTRVPIGSLVVDIPCLQEHIKAADDSVVLRRNIDYFIEPFRGNNSIRFVAGNPGDVGDVWEGITPPPRMWAETTYLDNSTLIESNFGIPAEFKLDQLAELESDLDYLSAVRGLWYSYLNGPTMSNLRIGTQILLGLPFAEEAGTIEEIRTHFSATQGRILIRDAANTAIVRSYTYPSALSSLEVNPVTKVPYVVGDIVVQLAPLVVGVEVIDYVKKPTWFQGLLSQGAFFEVEKFHTFMVRIDSAAFSLSALSFVIYFINRIKPKYTKPLFVAHKRIPDEDSGYTAIDVLDRLEYKGKLRLNTSVYSGVPYGGALMFDDFNPAGGGVRSQFDANSDQFDAVPVFPTPDYPITWGFDKKYLAPEDRIRLSWNVQHAGGPVAFDSGLFFDANNPPGYVFVGLGITSVPFATGYVFSESYVIGHTGAVNGVHLQISGSLNGSISNYYLLAEITGVNPSSNAFGFVVSDGGSIIDMAVSFPMTAGDVLTLTLWPNDGAHDGNPAWTKFAATFTQAPAVAFAFDSSLPAGFYCFNRTT